MFAVENVTESAQSNGDSADTLNTNSSGTTSTTSTTSCKRSNRHGSDKDSSTKGPQLDKEKDMEKEKEKEKEKSKWSKVGLECAAMTALEEKLEEVAVSTTIIILLP